jgi:uncharacterized protein (TIGR02271 family)
MANTVIAVYDNYANAQSAMSELLQCGFSRNDVQLSPSDESPDARQSVLRSHDPNDQGSTSDWSIGKFFRSLFGTGDGGESQRHHADIYSEAVRRGSYLVMIDAGSDEQRDRAADVMNRFDPVDIDMRSEHWKTQGWSRYDRAAPIFSNDEIARDRVSYASTLQGQQSMTGNRDQQATAGIQDQQATAGTQGQPLRSGTTEGEARIPVVEEQVKVGKREVQRGGVRVFQRVSEKPVQESVQLREEQVKVERHPVDQPASEADMGAFKEGSVEVRETAEEPVVSKTARVVEEVVISKEVRDRTEAVNDTVRRTDVEVEQLGAEAKSATSNTTMDDSDFRSHWQTSYSAQGGRYEDYAPAYSYGSALAGNEKYKGHRWNEIEPEARADWESRNAGSPWEKAKDAIRHGWEKMTK